MWYETEHHELINLDNVVSLRIIEQIKEGEPKGFWVVGLIGTGFHHVDVAQCKTPEEGKIFLQRLRAKISEEAIMKREPVTLIPTITIEG